MVAILGKSSTKFTANIHHHLCHVASPTIQLLRNRIQWSPTSNCHMERNKEKGEALFSIILTSVSVDMGMSVYECACGCECVDVSLYGCGGYEYVWVCVWVCVGVWV